MVRIGIIDDHRLVRQGITRLLENEVGITVVGEAGDADEGLAMIERERPDVVVLDLSLPGRSGLDVLLDIHARFDTVRVLVLSMHAEDTHGIRAIKAGAAGYLTKDAVSDELASAIQRIASGRRYITQSIAEQLADDIGKPHSEAPHERLSPREFEILLLISQGKQPRDIADILSIGERTVGTYRRRILEKLDLHSTAELVHYVLRHGLSLGKH